VLESTVRRMVRNDFEIFFQRESISFTTGPSAPIDEKR
jgi:hypothetical protein